MLLQEDFSHPRSGGHMPGCQCFSSSFGKEGLRCGGSSVFSVWSSIYSYVRVSQPSACWLLGLTKSLLWGAVLCMWGVSSITVLCPGIARCQQYPHTLQLWQLAMSADVAVCSLEGRSAPFRITAISTELIEGLSPFLHGKWLQVFLPLELIY